MNRNNITIQDNIKKITFLLTYDIRFAFIINTNEQLSTGKDSSVLAHTSCVHINYFTMLTTFCRLQTTV